MRRRSRSGRTVASAAPSESGSPTSSKLRSRSSVQRPRHGLESTLVRAASRAHPRRRSTSRHSSLGRSLIRSFPSAWLRLGRAGRTPPLGAGGEAGRRPDRSSMAADRGRQHDALWNGGLILAAGLVSNKLAGSPGLLGNALFGLNFELNLRVSGRP
jgi:hypothetical protein